MSVSGAKKAREINEKFMHNLHPGKEEVLKIRAIGSPLFCRKCGRFVSPGKTCICEKEGTEMSYVVGDKCPKCHKSKLGRGVKKYDEEKKKSVIQVYCSKCGFMAPKKEA